MALPKSSYECALDAWIKLLAEFRGWCHAETSHTLAWKKRPLNQSIAGCKHHLIDDVEKMLAEWRSNTNASATGSTSFLPVMLTAVAPVLSPPDLSMVKGIPYWVDVTIPDDPDQRTVQLRTIPTALRAQVVYICTNPHDAASISNQFCAFMTDDLKRRFNVSYDLGAGLVSQWPMTVVENSLYPDLAPSDEKTLTIITVDVTFVGNVPQVVGLDDAVTGLTDNGIQPDGTVGGDNGSGGGQHSVEERDGVVVLADVLNPSRHVRVDADPETGVRTVTEVIEP